jgi:hypothetical protein
MSVLLEGYPVVGSGTCAAAVAVFLAAAAAMYADACRLAAISLRNGRRSENSKKIDWS